MKHKVYIDPKGVAMHHPNWPELQSFEWHIGQSASSPNIIGEYYDIINDELLRAEYENIVVKKYDSDLEKAKSEAVPFEDQGLIITIVYELYKQSFNVREGFYDIEIDGLIVMVPMRPRSKGIRLVARIIPEPKSAESEHEIAFDFGVELREFISEGVSVKTAVDILLKEFKIERR